MFVSLHNVEKIPSHAFGRLTTRLAIAKGMMQNTYHTGGTLSIIWRDEADYNRFVDELLAFASNRQCALCSSILRVPEDDNFHLCLACRFRIEQTDTAHMEVFNPDMLAELKQHAHRAISGDMAFLDPGVPPDAPEVVREARAESFYTEATDATQRAEVTAKQSGEGWVL